MMSVIFAAAFTIQADCLLKLFPDISTLFYFKAINKIYDKTKV